VRLVASGLARAHVVLLLVLAWPGAPAAWAQAGSGGSISGYVVDQQGGSLPGVTIVAASSQTPLRHVVTTDERGYYRIPNLSPADYTITAERQGFAKMAREIVAVREGLNLTIGITMVLGTTTDVVTVIGEAAVVESKSVAQVVNISGDFQRAVPLSSLRSWTDFLLLTPGVVTTQGRFQSYSVHGTSSVSGAFLVDGADVTSVLQGSGLYSQFASDTAADIQIATAAVDASSPLGLGPVVTVATRSGSNATHGTASLTYQPEGWNADNTPNGQSLTMGVVQPEASLGGPLRRGALWFFGSVRIARNRTGVPRSAEQVEDLRLIDPAFTRFSNVWNGQIGYAKITGRLSPNHPFLASYGRDVVTYGGAQPNEAMPLRKILLGGPAYSARVSSLWGSSLMTRISGGINRKKQENENLQPDLTGVNVFEGVFPSAGRLFGSGLLGTTRASPNPAMYIPVHMSTIAADVTWYRGNGRQSHELQGGVYVQPLRRNHWSQHFNNGGFQVENMRLRDVRTPALGLAPFHRRIYHVDQMTALNVDSRDLGVYAQDAWHATSRLTLNAGIRVEFVKRVDKTLDVVTQDSTEIGPRIGANYLLTGDQRNAVRLSWSRIHDNLSANETPAGTNIAGFTDLYDTSGDGSFSTVFVTPSQTAVSRNLLFDLERYHQAHADELAAGYRRQLPGHASVGINVMRREYRGRPAAVETNGIYDGNTFAGYRDPSQNEVYLVTANAWNWPVVTSLGVEAARQTSRLQFFASYTREWNALAGTWQPNDPASIVQPDAFYNAYGIGFVSGCTSGPCSDSDGFFGPPGSGAWRTHVAKVAASYQPGWDVLLAATYNVQSGPWSGPILTRIAAPDPQFGPPTMTLSNGRVVPNPLATQLRFAYPTRADRQFTLGAFHLLNLRVGRGFSVGAQRLELAVDLLNVTNHGADQSFQDGANQLESPTFGKGANRQFPRSAALSARFVF
jgi:hypothetical protein